MRRPDLTPGRLDCSKTEEPEYGRKEENRIRRIGPVPWFPPRPRRKIPEIAQNRSIFNFSLLFFFFNGNYRVKRFFLHSTVQC
jgi:hypothetical protein